MASPADAMGTGIRCVAGWPTKLKDCKIGEKCSYTEHQTNRDNHVEPEFPFEFIIQGTPVSFQRSSTGAKQEWKELVRSASLAKLPEMHFATDKPLAVTLYYYPQDRMTGDIDNIVKLILDGMMPHLYRDDAQIERVVVQKFEKGRIFSFTDPSETLAECLLGPKPAVYVRVSNDPFEELQA
ncbi:RusA family crossover junction endodeoxyribonuclease [Rhizobium oryzicola]|uniref:RusA family crossover junction endodeoxyribonuclease n=1 Tax=Rhizobium oryzicola TaxID=1232668 RepID=A0ABT8SSB5_9HYPH|nr:RusA family crossover junction endodeoxyribonuclease [Rhizobium oryzicola]MDO1581310.1 RusA family crossover junction endodeoxyribonuclease [Rhizobium oryzicola]